MLISGLISSFELSLAALSDNRHIFKKTRDLFPELFELKILKN